MGVPSLDAGNQVAESLATTEWLGPLAPIALSPFFGLAIMSGAACYGPDWLTERSGLLSHDGAFANPTLFWCMLGLSVLSSLPRLSKVSKPIALASENLEAYSSVIILIALRFLNTTPTDAQPELVAGIPWDIAMSLVVLLNVVVVNSVKLFFEFLIWLVPFPSIDAFLEAGNKLLVAALMGLYMFSPTLATLLNLLILVACCLVFARVKRLTRKYRTLIIGPILARLLPNIFAQKDGKIDGFLTSATLGLPKHAHVELTLAPIEAFARARGQESSATVHLHCRRWFRVIDIEYEDAKLVAEDALLGKSLTIRTDDGKFSIAHRTFVAGDSLAVPSSPVAMEPA